MNNWRLNTALFLIRAAARPADADHMEGDLVEEFSMDPDLSPWWPLQQALASLPVLLRQQWDARQFAGGISAAALILLLSYVIYEFALSQVPLRANHAPGTAWLVFTAIAALAAAMIGARASGRRLTR